MADNGDADHDGHQNGEVALTLVAFTTAKNNAPQIKVKMANSGLEQTKVLIDASQSMDADGDPLQFTWQFAADVSFQQLRHGVIELTLPKVDKDTWLNFGVQVSDGQQTVKQALQLLVQDKPITPDPEPQPQPDAGEGSGGSINLLMLLALLFIAGFRKAEQLNRT
ncbi:GlyGly-CTERM sorting domain-containing protein [Shewanella marina]|uniref:GlyGly-CTERM sorting domain-containing protein n=1 Tax=Shewanella marina TaxID=487319 RepID=UPI000472AC5A|nr:GlyGly-CTERM sorting domain-containing protein [Shewanella marina]